MKSKLLRSIDYCANDIGGIAILLMTLALISHCGCSRHRPVLDVVIQQADARFWKCMNQFHPGLLPHQVERKCLDLREIDIMMRMEGR